MNPLKKLYCRTFQTIMRIALPFLPYREPKLIDGLNGIPAVLQSHGIQNILLITGRNIHKLGLTKPLETALSDAGITYTVFPDTTANPTISNVEAARQLYLHNHCQALIAFGGGSPMDCAKAVGARIARPDRPLSRMKGLLHVMRRLPLLIAVPTTAGSGSETTLAAVITDEKTRHKYPINDFALIPPYAVLDPQVTLGLSPMLTATTGMDALTHAIEAYIGRSTTKKTRCAARLAVKLILDNLPTAYENGQDLIARSNMQKASYLAGVAFTRSYVGYVHAIAHSLGGRYNLAHGLANSVLLPVVLTFYGSAVYPKLAELARFAGIAPADSSDEAAAGQFIKRIRRMNASMDIPSTLTDIQREDIMELAACADREANPLYPVPLLWDQKQLARIYEAVMP